MRQSGWNHLECSTCNGFKRDIQKNPDDLVLKQAYDAHLDRALKAREVYWNKRTKASMSESKGYLSIIIDAGGGSGCTHLPRFRNTEKSASNI